MSVSVVLNRCAVFLAPAANAEARAFITGVMKAVARYGPGGKFFRGDAAMFLTQAEEAAIFGTAGRALVKGFSTLFLVGAVLDTVRSIIAPGEEKREVATRLEMIQAQITKGGPLLTRALGVAEQVLFIITDLTGVAITDVAAGAFETFDNPMQQPGPNVSTNSYYRELLPQADERQLMTCDSIIEAPGLLLQPGLVPVPDPPAIPPPGPPMPSFGRRR
jgi:hypothetical protein